MHHSLAMDEGSTVRYEMRIPGKAGIVIGLCEMLMQAI
jgi:hypothetical protein